MKKKTHAEEITSLFDGPSELVFWSFRYFLGRRSIHATDFFRQLEKAWPLLTPHVREVILKELWDWVMQAPVHHPLYGDLWRLNTNLRASG